jgi:hypothetical protein
LGWDKKFPLGVNSFSPCLAWCNEVEGSGGYQTATAFTGNKSCLKTIQSSALIFRASIFLHTYRCEEVPAVSTHFKLQAQYVPARTYKELSLAVQYVGTKSLGEPIIVTSHQFWEVIDHDDAKQLLLTDNISAYYHNVDTSIVSLGWTNRNYIFVLGTPYNHMPNPGAELTP